MRITKENLDVPYCDFVRGATNIETPREFIRNTEKEFGLRPIDINNLSEDDLNYYIDLMDDFWNK